MFFPGTRLSVVALPTKVYILTLRKENVALHAFALIKLIFFNPSVPGKRFLSISESDDEISVIVEVRCRHSSDQLPNQHIL